MSWPAAVRSIVDTALETTVAPSFSRLGYRVRRSGWDWVDLRTYRLDGRTVLVTGSTSGIGFSVARELARLGATVLINGREEQRTRGAAERIASDARGGDVRALAGDVSDLDAARELADRLRREVDRLDVLIHNAGVLVHEHRTTPQGLELTVATHVVGPFLLTTLLLPLLRSSGRSRVLTVTSGGMYTQRLDVDRLEMREDSFDGVTAYARAKRAQVALTRAWAQRLAGQGIVVHATHPGWVDTPGVAGSLPAFHRLTGPLLRDVEQGADTTVWLAAADEPLRTTGLLWHDRQPRAFHRLPWTRPRDEGAEIRRLVAWCIERAGLTPHDRTLLEPSGAGA